MPEPLPLPQHLGTIEPPKDYYFEDRIPRLRDLLPKLHGRPGFVYSQVCIHNLRRAQDEGWAEVENTAVYSIKGPKGLANCKLMAIGKSVPGQSHASGRRVCLVDDEIEFITGLDIQPTQPTELESVEVSDAEVKANEGQTSGEKIEVQKTSGTAVEQREPVVDETKVKTKT